MPFEHLLVRLDETRIHSDQEEALSNRRLERLAPLWPLLFASLAVIYSVVVPVFESPDEIYHYPYVRHLATERRLPVQRPGQETAWAQEGSQPPLFYTLGALLTFWIDTDDLSKIRQLNPHARIGIPLAQDNKNIVVHTEAERFPWRGTVLAIHLVRFLSIALGTATVWVAYRTTRLLFPNRPGLVMGTMSLLIFTPQFLFISASVNNDNAVILFSTLSLYLFSDYVLNDRRRRRLVLLGIATGLAALSKISGLGLIPLMLFGLAWHRLQRSRSRDAGTKRLTDYVRDAAYFLLPALAVAGWWYLRNRILYGHWTGLDTMLDVFGRREGMPGLAELMAEFRGFRMSYWGLFGIFDVLMRPQAVYWLLHALSLIALVGLLRLAVRRWPQRRALLAQPRIMLLLLLALWTLIVHVALIRWTTMTKASQGRLVFPAILTLSLFTVWGILAWLPPKGERYVLFGMSGLLALLAISSPFATIAPAYAAPPTIRASEIPADATTVNIRYEDVAELLAYRIDQTCVDPGGSVNVTLYWRPLKQTNENLSIYLHLFEWQGGQYGQRDSYPGGGNYPTTIWSPGDIFMDEYQLTTETDVAEPTAPELTVGLYRHDSMEKLAAVDSLGKDLARPVLTRVKIKVQLERPNPLHQLNAEFGDLARLIGYEIDPTPFGPGQTVAVNLYWEVLGTTEEELHVLVHLLDSEGEIVAQGDGPPRGGHYPISYWEPGEYLVDQHLLEIPADAPTDTRIVVGLYRPRDWWRLPVTTTRSELRIDENRLELESSAP